MNKMYLTLRKLIHYITNSLIINGPSVFHKLRLKINTETVKTYNIRFTIRLHLWAPIITILGAINRTLLWRRGMKISPFIDFSLSMEQPSTEKLSNMAFA